MGKSGSSPTPELAMLRGMRILTLGDTCTDIKLNEGSSSAETSCTVGSSTSPRHFKNIHTEEGNDVSKTEYVQEATNLEFDLHHRGHRVRVERDHDIHGDLCAVAALVVPPQEGVVVRRWG